MILYSVKQAANYLGVKPETIRYHLYVSGHLKGQKVGNSIVFTSDELNHFLNNRPRPGKPRQSEN